MSDEVQRQPVNYRWDALNWDFVKLLAEIANYAAGKYGSAEQYVNGRLTGEKSPMNHIYEHLRAFQAGEPHDHFGTLEHQLAAIAYNAMMEYAYIKRFGHVPNKTMVLGALELKPVVLKPVEFQAAVQAPVVDQAPAEETKMEEMGEKTAVASSAGGGDLLQQLQRVLAEAGARFGLQGEPTQQLAALVNFYEFAKDRIRLLEKDAADAKRRVKELEDLKITPAPPGETDWNAGFEYYRTLWRDGLSNARTPETIMKFQAMLAAVDTVSTKIPAMFTSEKLP